MAHLQYFCTSPSSLFDHQSSSSFLSSPNLLQLTSSTLIPCFRNCSTLTLCTQPPLIHSKSIHLKSSQVSLQEPVTQAPEAQGSEFQSSSENPDALRKATSSSKKNYVWVNPNSPRAAQHRRNSYDARYTSLVRISESLDSCPVNDEDVSNVLFSLGDDVVEQDVVIVLNNMSNPETAQLALRYFQNKLKLDREVILYNVTLKVLRKCRDLNGAEKLFEDMLQRGVKPDNFTFSTIVSCARLCSLPNKAVEWFEKMPAFGCNPDEVTYSAMIDAYGRAGNVDKALSLYDRARTEKWRIDAVTFSTLIKIYSKSGNFDGCLNVYEEMKALGVKPNLVIYNTLIDAMGRAKRPWQAKNLFKEMTNTGILPNWWTYASLLRAFCRARYGEDAVSLYRQMKEKGLELNVILYNSLLAVCADVGYTEDAVEIYQDMKSTGTCEPDSWTFSSLITVYSCSGQVADAEATVNEMLESGYEPNIFVLTSLIQCYGKANRTDDVVRTYNRLSELGISPDDRFCGCLLNVMTQVPKEEVSKVAECIQKANPKLGHVIHFLVEENTNADGLFKQAASELFDTIGADVKKAFCNCLIDLCVNLNQLERACELLELGLARDIYLDIEMRTPTQWSLQLKSLSLGAALTALHVWMNDLTRALEAGEELPSLLAINTGHGKHKYSEKGLASVLESHLKELNAPFHEAPDKAGWFLTTKSAAISWLESRKSHAVVSA